MALCEYLVPEPRLAIEASHRGSDTGPSGLQRFQTPCVLETGSVWAPFGQEGKQRFPGNHPFFNSSSRGHVASCGARFDFHGQLALLNRDGLKDEGTVASGGPVWGPFGDMD